MKNQFKVHATTSLAKLEIDLERVAQLLASTLRRRSNSSKSSLILGQMGATQLSNNDALEVTKLMPLMIRICATRLNEWYGSLGFLIKGKCVE